jgi:glutamate synthase (ferredoxin)
VLDDELLSNAKLQAAIADEGTVDITTAIVNTDRSVGGRVAGQVAKKYGNHGFAGALNLTFEGSAGQSFGAFNVGGMNVKLVGEANDYVGTTRAHSRACQPSFMPELNRARTCGRVLLDESWLLRT